MTDRQTFSQTAITYTISSTDCKQKRS